MDDLDPRAEPSEFAHQPDEPAVSGVVGEAIPADPDLTAPTEPAVAAPDDSVAAPADGGKSRRTRWVLAGLVSALVIGGAVAAALILGAKPLPEALRYLPADSVIVAELRPDLPGDQRQHLGNFLAHFPGFADQSSLAAKLDETLMRLVNEGSSGSVDYVTRIKPLLTGPLVMGTSIEGLKNQAALAVASTGGVVTCAIVFGSATALETHRAVTIESIENDMACAVDGRFMLVGDLASVRAGIDAHLDHKGVDTNARFTTARTRLEDDQLALVYVDGKALTTLIGTMANDVAPGSGIDSAIADNLTDWIVIGMRVVDDAVQFELQAAPLKETVVDPSLPTHPPAASSRFASVLPPNTYGFVEIHGVGANLQRGLAVLKADPQQTDTVTQLEQALAAVGGIGNIAGWIEDAGVAVIPNGDSIGGAILLRGTDAAAVQGQVAQLRNLLVLASIGSDVTVHDIDHAGVKITSVDLGDLETLLSGLGVDPGLTETGARVAFSIAVRDDVLIVGIGDGVIEGILDTSAGSSLKSSGAYARVVGLVGSPNDVEVYVSLDGIFGYVEANLPAALDGTGWTELKPYLEHLASLGEANVTTSAGGRSRLVITVK